MGSFPPCRPRYRATRKLSFRRILRRDTRGLSTRGTRYPCVFDSRGCLSTRDEEGGRASDREGEEVGVVFRTAKRAVRFASSSGSRKFARVLPRAIFHRHPSAADEGRHPRSDNNASVAAGIYQGGSPAGSPASPECQRKECAWLGWREMTEPLQRVRDRDGGEGRQGGRKGKHAALPLVPSFTDGERPRTTGAPTRRAVRKMPHPVRRSNASHSPRLRPMFRRLPPPTMHVAASSPPIPGVVAARPRRR